MRRETRGIPIARDLLRSLVSKPHTLIFSRRLVLGYRGPWRFGRNAAFHREGFGTSSRGADVLTCAVSESKWRRIVEQTKIDVGGDRTVRQSSESVFVQKHKRSCEFVTDIVLRESVYQRINLPAAYLFTHVECRIFSHT